MTNTQTSAVALAVLLAFGAAAVKITDIGRWLGQATLDGSVTDILNKTPGVTQSFLKAGTAENTKEVTTSDCHLRRYGTEQCYAPQQSNP
jgi:hypothetical protein